MNTRLRVMTFLYHEVVDDPADSGFQRPSALPYKHDAAYFQKNLDVIAAGPVPPTLVSGVDLNAEARYLLLTFDDGGKSAMRTADYLDARGWKGHFFITTSMIGSRYFVAANDIRELRSRGHLIGSHSHTHPHVFSSLPEHELVNEWRTSCETLSSILSEPIALASVPGGDMDRRMVLAAAQAGVKCLFTSEPTATPWTCHGVVCFGRVCPKCQTSLRTIDDYVHFRGLPRQWFIRRSKQTVKRLLAPLYRRWANRSTHREARQ